MRDTGTFGLNLKLSSRLTIRARRLAAVLLGAALVLGAGPLHAQDDDDEDDGRPFERKMMDNLMSGLAGRKLEDGSIEYRERSPLVVPSQIALPPPQTAKTKPPPNWPKDPDEAELKAARELAKQKAVSPEEARRPLMPSEMVMKKPRGNGTGTIEKSDPSADVMVMPSQLGYKGGLFSGVLGDEKGESEKFVKEPQRIELTQPPTGYQTPSPNQAYGVGKREMTEQCDMSSGKCEKTWK